MRSEKLYLSDILEAAQAIERFLKGHDFDEFEHNEMLNSAVLQKLTVIGEAAARLSVEFRDRHPEVAWPQAMGLRNVAVHAYFSVDWGTIWITAIQDVPALRSQVAAILADEFPPS